MAVDFAAVEFITPEHARHLVGLDIPIYLPSLKCLCPAAAQLLGRANHGIILRGLPALTVAAAQGLVQHKWGLHLTGLTSISRDVGDVLSQHNGTLVFGTALKQLNSPKLATRLAEQNKWNISLDGLVSLSPEMARALACHRDDGTDSTPHLSLNGLRRLSAETATELAEGFKSLSLQGLSTGELLLESGAEDALVLWSTYAQMQLLVDDGPDLSGFLSRNYSPALHQWGVESLNRVVDEEGKRKWHYLDLDGLTSLNTQQVEAISEFDGDWVYLRGVRDIPPEIAKKLAAISNTDRRVFINPRRLTDPVVAGLYLDAMRTEREVVLEGGDSAIEEVSLDAAAELVQLNADFVFSGLPTLTADLAAILADIAGDLHLEGLQQISVDVASALANHRGKLFLDGLTAISTDAAKALASHSGKGLSLTGLKTLSNEAAVALSLYGHRINFDDGIRLSHEAKAALGRW
jgi:hypothetical protein